MFVTIVSPNSDVVWAREDVADVCVASFAREHETNGHIEYGLYCSFADKHGIGTRYILKPGYVVSAYLEWNERPVMQRKCLVPGF
jgi:hypothetical protein